MRTGFVTLLALALLLGAGKASAQIYAPESLARYFRLDWQVSRGAKGNVIDGYVYNLYNQNTERMTLRIDRLDGAGNVVGSTSTWVLGGVSQNNRAYFRASVPEAPGYRVQVNSFDWVGRGGS